MADSTPINFVKHIETYVDSSSSKSSAHQDASLDAIAKLLMNDMITLESLVREMGMYLTTTDNIIRARGILLLAELLTRLSSKSLENATIHSLIGFFAERLSDWRALRGALVGCLALMKRKGDISKSDATAVAQSFMQNLQVQSLGQHDRKLCFEILECLIDCYPDTVMTMEDDFVYVICEAIDGEKDPQCLLLTFHLVEIVAHLYPDSSNSLASYAEDLFNILGSYFPIHFTHPKGEDDVKREELSRALMLAFASTPLFEPFAIPLLLEKLSSSLPSSKVESLKYLSYCTVKYGPHRMLQHFELLWSSLKDTIFTSGQSDNKIASESLILLKNLIQQDDGKLVNLILNDADITSTLKSLNTTVPDHQRLNAIGRILHVSATSSIASCNAIFQSFFSDLVTQVSERPNFGCIYICVELLSACRSLFMNHGGPTSMNNNNNNEQPWCIMLHSLCDKLTSSLVKSIKESNEDAYSQSGVEGLKILALFPGSFMGVSKVIFESILVEFVSVIVSKFDNGVLWGSVLKALSEIGSFIEESHDFEKIPSFDVIVVEKMVGLLSDDDSSMPFSLKVKAVSEIGTINLKYMMKIVEELNKSIITSLHKSWIDGNSKSAEHAMLLLECYDNKVLPWFQNVNISDDVATNFALKIWEQIEEDITSFSDTHVEKKLLEATMDTMKNAVASCSSENQTKILDKSFTILSSTFKVKKSNPVNLIISLFDSVIIALHPKTHVKNPKIILQILTESLTNHHIPSSHALGSFFNKIPSKESIDISFSQLTKSCSNVHEIVGLSWMGKGLVMRGDEKVKDVIMFFLDFLISNSSQDQEMMRAVADSFGVMMSDSEKCLNKKLHAVIKPLYKQRLFSIVVPILQSSIMKSDSLTTRSMLHRALAHVISNAPLSAVLGEAKKLIALMLDGLTILSEDVENRDILYNLLLVLSGILTDKNGEEAIVENVYIIVRCLSKLVAYPHMMLVRETAIQCLTAMSELPYARVYPFRQEVVQALSKALDDSKRSVRQEAVKCRQAWASISSRSLHI